MRWAAKAGALVALWVVLMAPPGWSAGTPGSGIAGSSHDFTNPAGRVYQADPHASICIFCHIYESAGSAFRTSAGIQLSWNHRLSAQDFFWSGATETEGGTQLPTNLATWAGSSKFCLSCHDGTVSLGDVYQGNYPAISFIGGAPYADRSGVVPDWVGGEQGLLWAGGGSGVDPTGRLAASCFHVGANGDLEGTHPVGIPYPYRRVGSTYNGITTGPGVDVKEYVATPVRVKLFTDIGNDVIRGPQIGATGIECASCHDVHNEAVRDRHLLRDSARQLCLDCHLK